MENETFLQRFLENKKRIKEQTSRANIPTLTEDKVMGRFVGGIKARDIKQALEQQVKVQESVRDIQIGGRSTNKEILNAILNQTKAQIKATEDSAKKIVDTLTRKPRTFEKAAEPVATGYAEKNGKNSGVIPEKKPKSPKDEKKPKEKPSETKPSEKLGETKPQVKERTTFKEKAKGAVSDIKDAVVEAKAKLGEVAEGARTGIKGKVLGALEGPMKLLGPLVYALEGYHAVQTLRDDTKSGGDKAKIIAEQAGGLAGMEAGGVLGATWGSAAGPYGTLAGGIVGGGAGYFLGAKGVEQITTSLSDAISNSKVGEIIGEGAAIAMSPFSEDARFALKKEFTDNIIPDIANEFKPITDLAKPLLENLGKLEDKVSAKVKTGVSSIEEGASNAWKDLAGAYETGGIGSAIKMIPRAVSEAAGGVSNAFTGSGTAPLGNVGNSFSAKSPQVMQRLMDQFQLTPQQAASILGNLGQESGGLQPDIEGPQTSQGRAKGWAQVLGPRRREYEQFAADKGLDINSDEANYQFLVKELQSKQYASAITNLKATSGGMEGVKSFEGDFEKSGRNEKAYGSRMKYYNQALDAYNRANASGNINTASITPARSDVSTLGKSMTDSANNMLVTQTQQAIDKGITYKFGSKNINSGGIDCSGWVQSINKNMMEGINRQAGKQVFSPKDEGLLNDSASGIISNVSRATGILKTNADLRSSADLKEGMMIGLDTGEHGWDNGRAMGIDHITQVVKNPDTGKLMISQSSSHKGPNLTDADEWLNRNQRKGNKLYATDPMALASSDYKTPSGTVEAKPINAMTTPTPAEQRLDSAGLAIASAHPELNLKALERPLSTTSSEDWTNGFKYNGADRTTGLNIHDASYAPIPILGASIPQETQSVTVTNQPEPSAPSLSPPSGGSSNREGSQPTIQDIPLTISDFGLVLLNIWHV
jgi:hypothetical protein